MAGYIGTQAVSVNTTSATISDDLTVGDDATIAGTLGVTQRVTANAGVVVDNITIDGNTVSLSSGDFLLDVAGDIIFDADGEDLKFKDGTVHIASLFNQSSDFVIQSAVTDKDIIFKGDDNESIITALTLDMSDAGTAKFNNDARFVDDGKAIFGTDSDLKIYHSSGNSYVQDDGAGQLRLDTNGTDVRITKTDSEFMGKFIVDGAVELYHNNSKKIETTAAGVTVTGTVLAADGTASLPAYSFSGDPNTGMFTSASDNLNFVTGGVSRAFITATQFNCTGNAIFGGSASTFAGTVKTTGNITVGPTTGLTDTTGVLIGTSGGQTNVINLTTANEAHIYNNNNDSGATYKIDFRQENVSKGSISVASGSTTFSTSSDYRLKENVDYDWDATTRLKQLKPARFNWIADDTNTLIDGFLAHEAQTVVPESIIGEKDAIRPEVLYVEGDELPDGKNVGDVKEASAPDYQQIDQSKLVPLLVKTIQELEARITALEG